MGDTLRQAARDLAYEQELWTFNDVVEFILDAFDIDRDLQSRQLRLARRAVLTAHRLLPSYKAWTCYWKTHRFVTAASQTSSTITFDFTGGANERMVTLAAGTWPTWAEFGQIHIADVDYDIEQRVSDTVITLPEFNNPGADVAAGTSYEIVRSRYPLPLDYRRGGDVLSVDDEFLMEYVSPNLLHQSSIGEGSESPWQHSIVSDPKYLGALMLQLNPPPSSAVVQGFLYERMPRPLKTDLYNTGTVTTTGSDTTVSGTSTVWTSDHVGAVIRISSDGRPPTSVVGSASGIDNPYTAQRVIMAVASGTSLTVDATISTAVTTTAYTISDPIDMHYQTMLDAFLRLSEWQFAILTNRKDIAQREAWFKRSLDVAMDADRRHTGIRNAVTWADQRGIRVDDVAPLG